jgi:hypothetical protein
VHSKRVPSKLSSSLSDCATRNKTPTFIVTVVIMPRILHQRTEGIFPAVRESMVSVLCLCAQTHPHMELSPSSEAANCAATLKLPSILWNPEVHHRVHMSPPPLPILSQIDPNPTIPSYLSKIHLNIVHPTTSWSSKWSLLFWLSHQ